MQVHCQPYPELGSYHSATCRNFFFQAEDGIRDECNRQKACSTLSWPIKSISIMSCDHAFERLDQSFKSNVPLDAARPHSVRAAECPALSAFGDDNRVRKLSRCAHRFTTEDAARRDAAGAEIGRAHV